MKNEKETPQVGDVWYAPQKGRVEIKYISERGDVATILSKNKWDVIFIQNIMQTMTILERNGKPVTEPETLEDRIQAKWPDKEVVMLEFLQGVLYFQSGESTYEHCMAQSWKGFAGFVYEEDGLWFTAIPVEYVGGEAVHPVAVLFNKDSE